MGLPTQADFLSIGMSFLYDRMRDPRLTTAATVRFGPLATRNVVDLDTPRVEDFVARREIPLGPDSPVTGHGYLMARHRGIIVGLGHARSAGEGFVVVGMEPRSGPSRR